MPNPLSPQNWNRYTYSNNNPLRYTDPSGHCGRDHNPAATDLCNELRADIEGRYDVSIQGAWTLEELQYFEAAMTNVADFVGGDAEVNKHIANATGGTEAYQSSGRMPIIRGSDKTWSSGNPNTAGYFKGMIYLPDEVFEFDPIRDRPITRPGFFTDIRTVEESAKISIQHEFAHLLADSVPDLVKDYASRPHKPFPNVAATDYEEDFAVATGILMSVRQTTPNWKTKKAYTRLENLIAADYSRNVNLFGAKRVTNSLPRGYLAP